MKKLQTILLFLIAFPALAIDHKDAREFNIVSNETGKPTSYVFRTSDAWGVWNIENRSGYDGSGEWVNYCGVNCEMKETRPEDFAKFFKDSKNAQAQYECVSNEALAFCKSKDGDYIFATILKETIRLKTKN